MVSYVPLSTTLISSVGQILVTSLVILLKPKLDIRIETFTLVFVSLDIYINRS